VISAVVYFGYGSGGLSWINLEINVIANGQGVGRSHSLNLELPAKTAFKPLAMFVFNGVPTARRFCYYSLQN
jgi:hypothetical protein